MREEERKREEGEIKKKMEMEKMSKNLGTRISFQKKEENEPCSTHQYGNDNFLPSNIVESTCDPPVLQQIREGRREKEQVKKKNNNFKKNSFVSLVILPFSYSLTLIGVRADGCDIVGCARLINNADLSVVSLGEIKSITRIHTVGRNRDREQGLEGRTKE